MFEPDGTGAWCFLEGSARELCLGEFRRELVEWWSFGLEFGNVKNVGARQKSVLHARYSDLSSAVEAQA